jgi:hypothetical protein
MRMFSSRTVGFALACQALACWPSVAHAQITAPREASQIEFGPLSLYPTVQIIDAGVDTNVFNDAEQPKEDYTFTVSSAALAVLRVGANELMLESGGDYVWFRDYASERSASARYAMRFNFSASRFKPYFGAQHNRTRARQGVEIDGRVRRLERSALAGFAVEMTPRTSIIASLRFDDGGYEPGEEFRGVDLAQALNRTGRTYSGGVRHALTPLTSLVVTGDYAENEFSQSHVRDSKSFSIAPALEFSPDAAIRGRVSAGVQVFQPVDPALPDYTGAIMSAALNWSLYAKTVLDIQATRNVSYSYLESQPYYLLTGLRAALTRPVFGPVAVHGGADWEYLKYQWHQGVLLDTDDFRGDTTKTVFGGLRINVGRGFVIGVTAERLRRRSNVDARQNFDRTRLLSSLTIGS